MIPKFRAWDKTEKVMHYDVEKTYDNLFGNLPMSEQSFGEVIKQAQSGKYVLMQCTGLCDKNKSKLYDRDIVKAWSDEFDSSPTMGVVSWDKHGQWVFDFEDGTIPSVDIFSNCAKYGSVFCGLKMEKVGNVFENENFLGGKLKETYLKRG